MSINLNSRTTVNQFLNGKILDKNKMVFNCSCLRISLYKIPWNILSLLPSQKTLKKQHWPLFTYAKFASVSEGICNKLLIHYPICSFNFMSSRHTITIYTFYNKCANKVAENNMEKSIINFRFLTVAETLDLSLLFKRDSFFVKIMHAC